MQSEQGKSELEERLADLTKKKTDLLERVSYIKIRKQSFWIKKIQLKKEFKKEELLTTIKWKVKSNS